MVGIIAVYCLNKYIRYTRLSRTKLDDEAFQGFEIKRRVYAPNGESFIAAA